MKKYGLPTFPIFNGMDVGEREIDELEWLLEHGFFIDSPIGGYLAIRRINGDDPGYGILSGSHERYMAHKGETCVLQSDKLALVLKSKRVKNLARWQWYEDKDQ